MILSEIEEINSYEMIVAEQSENMMEEAGKKPFNFKTMNAWILFLNLVFPAWFVAWMYPCGISTNLLLFMAVCTLALGAVYKIVNKLGKGRKILTVARCIAVFSIILYYAPTVMLLGFQETKPLYGLKRWVYLNGNFSEPEKYYGKLLPEKLPRDCRDYYFWTQGSVIAQDYHPSSLLIFHTDEDSIESYTAYYSTLLDVQLKTGEEVQGNLGWLISLTNFSSRVSDDLSECEVYYFKGRFPDIVLINRSTGLVAIYT